MRIRYQTKEDINALLEGNVTSDIYSGHNKFKLTALAMHYAGHTLRDIGKLCGRSPKYIGTKISEARYEFGFQSEIEERIDLLRYQTLSPKKRKIRMNEDKKEIKEILDGILETVLALGYAQGVVQFAEGKAEMTKLRKESYTQTKHSRWK